MLRKAKAVTFTTAFAFHSFCKNVRFVNKVPFVLTTAHFSFIIKNKI